MLNHLGHFNALMLLRKVEEKKKSPYQNVAIFFPNKFLLFPKSLHTFSERVKVEVVTKYSPIFLYWGHNLDVKKTIKKKVRDSDQPVIHSFIQFLLLLQQQQQLQSRALRDSLVILVYCTRCCLLVLSSPRFFCWKSTSPSPAAPWNWYPF